MAINGTFGSSSSEIYIYIYIDNDFFFFLGYIHGFKIKSTKYGVYCHIFMVLCNSSAINFCRDSSFPYVRQRDR